MRYKLPDVLRNPTRLPVWWFETPWKRPRNWQTLLLEPGRGWLRWAMGTYDYVEPVLDYGQGPTFTELCSPPVRRLAQAIWIRDPRWLTQGKDPDWPDDYLLP